jgi:hypothetical protein
MLKLIAVLALLGTTGTAAAQTAPATATATATADQAQPAKPQMVKKRVCEVIDEDPSSRLGNRKICKTIEVPAQATPSTGVQGQAPAPRSDG